MAVNTNPGENGSSADAIQKPFHLAEVLARIEEILSRSAGTELSEAQELEGSLGQLPLPDLLQMLKLNRRSGRLEVSRGNEQGTVVVAEGRPVDAAVGTVQGEKALFRLLTWSDGNFAFVAGVPAGVPRIERGMDEALLEGMRQADEVRRYLSTLPPLKAGLARTPAAVGGTPMDSVTGRLLAKLSEPHSLGELLDLDPTPDLAVLEAVSRLLRRGLLRVSEPESVDTNAGPLLGAAEVHALRARMLRGRRGVRSMVAKVLVCSHAADRTRRFLGQLPSLGAGPEEAAALESGFGTVARLELGEGLRLDFCILPGADATRPLWRPFSAGAVGVLVLDAEDDTLALAAALAHQLRLRVVCTAPEVPPLLASAPLGVAAVPEGAEPALRALLTREPAHPAPADAPA